MWASATITTPQLPTAGAQGHCQSLQPVMQGLHLWGLVPEDAPAPGPVSALACTLISEEEKGMVQSALCSTTQRKPAPNQANEQKEKARVCPSSI